MTTEADLLRGFPPELAISPEKVARAVTASGTTLVVLDDDPTGTQSVFGVPVLTAWERSDFLWAFSLGAPAIYVLTNTRSLDGSEAAQRTREVVVNASAASVEAGVRIAFVSRSDSTLRGHFPLETDAIADAIETVTGRVVDAVVIVPAFPDAGRITIASTHYMRGDGDLVPIAETEFARDATFGFHSSNLRDYVEEKSDSRWSAGDVASLDLGTVRDGADAIARVIAPLRDSTPVVVDAVTENDLRSVALGCLAAEAAGKVLVYRVGPPFVRARIGQAQREPLTVAEVYGAGFAAVGGLIVVGSHVGLTSRQLAELQRTRPLAGVLEIDLAAVLDGSAAPHLAQVAASAIAGLHRGDVVIHTSRLLRTGADSAESLDISRRVSAAVVEVVQAVLAGRHPRFVIGKGGITSSDVAAYGLGIRHAIVRGPMLPGIVSLWEPVDGPAAGIPYVVFAGNVGDDDSLARVVGVLAAPVLTDPASSIPAPRTERKYTL